MTVSTTCYLPFIPPDPAKIDATGHIQGSDLRGTSAYEHFVDSLSKHQDPAVQASSAHREQASAAVNAMKIKSGTILVVPCSTGRTGEPQALSATPPVPIGFWHNLVHLGKQFFNSLTNENNRSLAETQTDIRDYNRYMSAIAYSSSM